MAATWDSEWTVTDHDARRVQLVAVRTDGLDVRTYMAAAQIDDGDTTASLRSVADAVFAQHEAAVAAEDADAALTAGWKVASDAYLDGLETP